jgi:hypothetical protein
VVRDPAKNEPFIAINRERQRLQSFHIAGQSYDKPSGVTSPLPHRA